MFPRVTPTNTTQEMVMADRDVLSNVAAPTANTTLNMTSGTRVYHVSVGATFTLSLVLPAVGECVGIPFFVKTVSGGGAAITINDNGDDPAFTQVVLSTTKDAVMLISDGTYWYCFNAQDYTGAGA